MAALHPFRTAVEKQDLDAVRDLLAEDATFLSPVAFKPYHGKEMVFAILRGAMRVFQDFHYVKEIEDGEEHALVFKARIDNTQIHGCDFLTMNEDGLIQEFCVMLRPMSAVHAMSEAMRVQFELIEQEMRGC
ncbi:nuclear transport factor 2 family protein [Actinocorallia sp. B10E7]|uniref:nuclear transport factor 2 family protein n=1 Tax=Actinocorallia sp. B10E7 TaxID=3153558 RepID=UPI00325F8F8F